MLAKKSKSGLRFGLILAFIATLLFGCVSPTATLPVQPSLQPVTEFPTSETTNAKEATLSPTKAATAMPTLGIGSMLVSPVDGMVAVYVPAGDFLMGSDKAKDNQADSNELPQHTVYLEAYWIDKYEVTNAQYARCLADSQCTPPHASSSYTHSSYYGDSQFTDYPVIYVGWNQAQAYCTWAGQRLPSEAEWEKAARGSEGHIYPWGNQSPDSSLANYNQNAGDTSKVGNYPSGASPYRALDMAGNVWEWVNDWYSETYYQQSPLKNPTGPTSGTYRVLRGGSWSSYGWIVRSAIRYRIEPDFGSFDIGFRCAASP